MKARVLTLALALCLTFAAKAQYPNVTLYNIQYTTVANGNSPYMNQFVNTGGIVTASYGSGYYVQTTRANQWAGVNVYDKTHAPAVGDSITFTGEVIEYYSETEMQTITNYVTVSTGNQALTPPTVVGFDSIQQEKYEGMLVKIKDATCVRYNAPKAWYVFTDSTMTKGKSSLDTVDNINYTYPYSKGKNYSVTGCVHFEYANWIEPRNKLDIDSINVTAVGIANYVNDLADINVYPNPSNGVFTVSVNALANEKNTGITLTDITGRIIYTEQLDINAGTHTLPINAGTLAKGCYFLQLSNAQYSAVKKVIIN